MAKVSDFGLSQEVGGNQENRQDRYVPLLLNIIRCLVVWRVAEGDVELRIVTLWRKDQRPHSCESERWNPIDDTKEVPAADVQCDAGVLKPRHLRSSCFLHYFSTADGLACDKGQGGQ